MKKGVKTALLTALFLLIVGMALIAVSLLRGGSIQDIWNNASLNMNVISTGYGDLKGYTVCRTGEESFSPDEVRSIDLGWISGSVRLQSGSGERITLKESCEKPLKDDQKLCWKLEKGTLSIRFCSALQTRLSGKDLVLTVPAGWTAESIGVHATSADLELNGLRVEGILSSTATSGIVTLDECSCRTLAVSASSGEVSLNGCVFDKLDTGASSGSISLKDCDGSELRFGATSGAISIDGGRCDTLKANTTSGNIYVRTEAKEIRLESTSGSIRCEEVSALCSVSIDTTSGTVKLALLDTGNDQRIEIETTSGDVYLDVPGAIDLDYDTASGDMHGRLEQGGSGCPKVEIETTSGDLILGAFD
ncbi:MAG: DUF4097 family beta strand repeat-containing protein [Clostridia bacterium]